MKFIRFTVLLSLLVSLNLQGQRWNTPIGSNQELRFLRASGGLGYELNHGLFRGIDVSLEYEDYALGFRYYWGQEYPLVNLLNQVSYPIRDIQSFGVLYYAKLHESFRLGFGLASTRGNARGELIDIDNNSTPSSYFYEDFRYRAVSISFDMTYGFLEYKNFGADVFLRSEILPKRIYVVVGLGLSVFLPIK